MFSNCSKPTLNDLEDNRNRYDFGTTLEQSKLTSSLLIPHLRADPRQGSTIFAYFERRYIDFQAIELRIRNFEADQIVFL